MGGSCFLEHLVYLLFLERKLYIIEAPNTSKSTIRGGIVDFSGSWCFFFFSIKIGKNVAAAGNLTRESTVTRFEPRSPEGHRRVNPAHCQTLPPRHTKNLNSCFTPITSGGSILCVALPRFLFLPSNSFLFQSYIPKCFS